MLGYTQFDNSICVFLEDKDIKKLGKQNITGTYVNRQNPDKRGIVELSQTKLPNTIEGLMEELKETSSIDTITDADAVIKMTIQIRSAVYMNLLETGYSQAKSENGSVFIYDAKRLLHHGNPFDQLTYGLLKKHEMQLNQKVKNQNIWNLLWQRRLTQ